VKVLFINPPVNKITEESEALNLISGSKNSIELNFAYLDAVLKSINGVKTDYIDFRIEKDDIINVLLNEKKNFDFNIAAISCYSRNYLSTIRIAKLIKKIDNDIIVIVGGFHPTINPTDFIFNNAPFDYVVRGEGENAILQIFNQGLKSRKKPVIINSSVIKNLDEIPLINLGLYLKYKDQLDFNNIYIYFSRGCINDCSFCISRDDTCGMKKYRVLSPSKALKQLKILEKYNPNRIIIQDPIFGVNPNWFKSILSLLGNYKERPYGIRLETHIDLLNKDKINLLRKNRINLTVGFESASRKMLYLMNKTKDPNLYLKRMINLITNYCNSENELMINLLFGHPGETKTTISETFQFLDKHINSLNGIVTKFSIFRLYPGTTIYKHTKFFERILGSRFYYKEWWYLDADYSILPSLLDPSRDLTLHDEFSLLLQKVETYFNDLIFNEKNLSIRFKFFYLKFLMNIKRTYTNLIPKFVELRKEHRFIKPVIA
ncbi:MAG: B12-binding domain-containing radical SAM protein, partial [Promethearchaeota archaeon]